MAPFSIVKHRDVVEEIGPILVPTHETRIIGSDDGRKPSLDAFFGHLLKRPRMGVSGALGRVSMNTRYGGFGSKAVVNAQANLRQDCTRFRS